MAIGLAFADGSQVLGRVLGPAGNEEPHGRVLHPIEGVVRTRREDARWWTWPLPPGGRWTSSASWEKPRDVSASTRS